MEQNNIEKFVKKVLKERSIEPTPEARERLIEALNSSGQKKKRMLWANYAVAASIVLTLLFLGGRYMLNTPNNVESIKVTIQEDIPEPIQDHAISPSMDSTIKAVNIEVKPNANKAALTQLKEVSNTEIADAIVISNELEKRAFRKEINNLSHEDNRFPIKTITAISENKIDTLLLPQNDTIQKKLHSRFMYITPEQLLSSVETDSSQQLQQGVKKAQTIYVESGALLVEMERQIFEEKNENIFRKVKRELKKVKSAVANRNYKD